METESKIKVVENVEQMPMVSDQTNTMSAIMLNPALLEQAGLMAKQMASAKVTVPKHFQGQEGDCYAIVLQSIQWKMSPFVVAQKTHIVQGNLGYEAQLIIAVAQASGAIKGAFKYEYRGEGANLECRVGAIISGDQVHTYGTWLRIGDVTTKNSPLWKTNPPQQLGYLQAKNWCRLYCPGAILGVYSPDELEEFAPAKVVNETEADSSYPQKKFDDNYPEWKKLVANGQQTAESIITGISGRCNLTDGQIEELNKLTQFAPIDGEQA